MDFSDHFGPEHKRLLRKPSSLPEYITHFIVTRRESITPDPLCFHEQVFQESDSLSG